MRMPEDPNFPARASDWLTGEVSPNVTFQQGKWWTGYHWVNWGRDRLSDILKFRRNRAVSRFLSNQSASTGL